MNTKKEEKPIVNMKVMTIVHGKSEYCICKSIKSNLRLKQEIIARDKGKSSIQINGIVEFLNKDKRFCDKNSFKTEFTDIKYEDKKLLDFQLFIIMDTDDCDTNMKRMFKDKTLFKRHWLYDYIVPIYNEPNLEKTMKDAKIPIKEKKDYIQIFPTNHGDLDMKMAEEFLKKLKNCKNTNLDIYIERCISIAKSLTKWT